MARDIGSSLLSGFESTFSRGDPLKDKLLASAYNDERNREISRQNASTITEFEMNFIRKGGNEGQSIADIKGTDLLAGQDKLPPGGMAALLNQAGMNVALGAGPNMSFSDVRLGKDENGEDAVLLRVASIENQQDEKGFFNIRARRNAVTKDGIPEAEGGEPIAMSLDEFNAAYDMYKRNAALGTGNEHLIKQLDPSGAAFNSGILEPAVIEDPNQIGNVDLSIIEEVRKANELAIQQYQEESQAGLVQSGSAYSRSADETFILNEIYTTGDKIVHDPTASNPLAPGQVGSVNVLKGNIISPKYSSVLDHSGGEEIPFNLTAQEWNNTLSPSTRKRLKEDFKAQTMSTFDRKISDVQRSAKDIGIPPPHVSLRMPGTDKDHADRVGAHKLIRNKHKELRDAFYVDKGLYGEFLDDPKAFAFKYSDTEGNFVNWKAPKPDRKVVKELANLSKKIDNPELKKALNEGDTAKITSLLEQYGTAEENLSSEGQESVVNQLVQQEGQSAYPKPMRAKLMYLMTADMPEDRALAWFNGAGGTYIDTGQWDRQAIANLKNSGLSQKERINNDIKFVDNYKNNKYVYTGGGGSPTTDEDKIPLTTFLESASEDQWETYGDQVGDHVMDASARALLYGHVDGIRTTNRDVKRIFAKTMEAAVTDGVWNSIVSLPIFRGMPDRGVLGDDAGNFVAVNKNTNQIIDDPAKMDPRITVFYELDTFGQGQRGGEVSYSKIASQLSSMNNSSEIMRHMEILAAQNARYAQLLGAPIE